MEYGLRENYHEYVVEKGDSLFNIAKKHNVNINELIDINMLTSNVIYPGQVLLIPKDDNSDFLVDIYITEPSDTFYKISKKSGVDVQTLANYNDVGNYALEKGQIIKIPKTRTYVVDSSDTVETILKKTNRSAEELLQANAEKWLKCGNRIVS